MNLTGKCKKAFEKYFNESDINIYQETCMECGGFLDFKNLPSSMKFGVYVDFFDSINLIIEVERLPLKNYWVVADNALRLKKFNTRSKAREHAIKKANKIFNNK